MSESFFTEVPTGIDIAHYFWEETDHRNPGCDGIDLYREGGDYCYEAEREALAVALLAHEMRSWKAAPDPSELMSHDPANWRCVNAVDAAHAIAPAVEALLAARLAPIEALAEEWASELAHGNIRSADARYCWDLAARELRRALATPRPVHPAGDAGDAGGLG